MFVFHGQERVPVVECGALAPGESVFAKGTLYVAPGMQIDVVLFRMNCTPEDVQWLKALKIEAP